MIKHSYVITRSIEEVFCWCLLAFIGICKCFITFCWCQWLAFKASFSGWDFQVCLGMYSVVSGPFWVHSTTEWSAVSVAGFPVLATVSVLLCGSLTGCFHHIMLKLQFTSYVALYQAGVFTLSLRFFSSQPSFLLVVTGYYFTFPLKFLFQCDWCLGSLQLWGARGWVAGSVCPVGGLTSQGWGYRACVGCVFLGHLTSSCNKCC